MKTLTIEEALVADQDPLTRWAPQPDDWNEGRLYTLVEAAFECDEGTRLVRCRRYPKPSAAALVGDLIQYITEDMEGAWEWSCILCDGEPEDDALLYADDFRDALRTACEVALRHYSPDRVPHWEWPGRGASRTRSAWVR